jgi:hypothetical protein
MVEEKPFSLLRGVKVAEGKPRYKQIPGKNY